MIPDPLQETRVIPLEILVDRSSTGRVRPWRDYKLRNTLLATAYDEIDVSKAARLRSCCTTLVYVDTEGGKRLEQANSCRVRLCPICQWRRSLKVYTQTAQILQAMGSDRSYRYLLLTLTVRNVPGEELSETIDRMFDGWDRLSRRKEFSRVVKGWYRGVEVTHQFDLNTGDLGTFHPHYHCLLAVNPSYFTSRDYLSQARWTEIWQQSMRLDYTPIVDVRRVRASDASAVAEVCKYAAKDADYIIPDDWGLTVDTVRILDPALANRRLVAYGGEMRRWHRLLHLDDPDEGDLVHLDGAPVEPPDPSVRRYIYCWYTGYRQYFREDT